MAGGQPAAAGQAGAPPEPALSPEEALGAQRKERISLLVGYIESLQECEDEGARSLVAKWTEEKRSLQEARLVSKPPEARLKLLGDQLSKKKAAAESARARRAEAKKQLEELQAQVLELDGQILTLDADVAELAAKREKALQAADAAADAPPKPARAMAEADVGPDLLASILQRVGLQADAVAQAASNWGELRAREAAAAAEAARQAAAAAAAIPPTQPDSTQASQPTGGAGGGGKREHQEPGLDLEEVRMVIDQTLAGASADVAMEKAQELYSAKRARLQGPPRESGLPG